MSSPSAYPAGSATLHAQHAPAKHPGTSDVVLRTERLEIRTARPDEAAAVADYFRRNREHLAPWEPTPPPGFFGAELWTQRLELFHREADEGRGMRLHLFERARPGRVVGTVGVQNIVRAAFWCAHLGFGLDAELEGRGVMSEALRAVIAHAFGPVNLHRLEANHQPQNLRSAAVLRKNGFVPTGFARDYLFIAGAWRDHVQTALINPAWVQPPLE